MAVFTLRGLAFEVPPFYLRGKIEEALALGRYEHQEADAISTHLCPGDRLLELGAGIGYICTLAARIVGEGAVVGIEASSEILSLARMNLALNGFGKVQLIHAAATGEAEGKVEFVPRQPFWSSALKSTRVWPDDTKSIGVPAIPIAKLLEMARPTVLCIDIEGAEIDILIRPLPGVRLIIVEFHPQIYGDGEVDRVVAALEAMGFALEMDGSKGSTVVFRRDTPDNAA